MKNKRFTLLLGVIVTSLAILFSACKKLNEATELGGGLIPPVDNITTFDTLIDVETYNGIFSIINDSIRLTPSDEHFLGKISNDPIFGSTDAQLFLELKPPSYRYSFANIGHPDSLLIDSAVLVLDYVETYGDTNTAQTINVYEITSDFKYDSSYYVNRNSLTTGAQLGSATILPHQLNDSIKAFLDTNKNQLRVRLTNPFRANSNFGEWLLRQDSIGLTGAFSSDSAFKTKFKGFAIKSEGGGNAIMGVNLTGANTKLAIYYRYQKGGPGIAFQDTIVNYFSFTALSASANYITRTHTAAITSAATSPAADPIVYIQNSPGTFATIKIPGLAGLSNRLVHRAELIMEQVYDISDSTFPAPASLYVDAYDPTISNFRTIPYDLQPDESNALVAANFGGVPFYKQDLSGNIIRIWRFNVSRYVQHVLTHTLPSYDLRVFAPYYIYEQFGIPPLVSDVGRFVTVNPSIAKGRVRLHGGDPTRTNPQRMRLRIIYSKI